MKAQQIIEQHRHLWVASLSANQGLIADDNVEVIEFLNSVAVHVREIAGQETWVFNDGSYITRNADEYWFDSDVTDFESQYE
jgi:hypothetical protein